MYYSQDFAIANDECDEIVSNFDALGYDQAYVGERGVSHTHIRSTSIHWVDPTKLINKAIYGFILEVNNRFFKYNIDKYENLQFGKYEVGNFYDWHRDSIDQFESPMTRKLSATVVLSDSDSYEGGAFEFFNGIEKPIRPIQSKGTVIIFDSQDWHRITKVTKGVRYSLVMWANGTKFK